MRISVLTPSNGRPEQLELCRQYVARQTAQAFEHVVVDEPRGLVENLIEGLAHVAGDAVAIFEDDDWYHPAWLEQVAQGLERAELVGERIARYYHVPTGGFWSEDLAPTGRASLCATALRAELVPLLLEILETSSNPFVDLRFWSQAKGTSWELLDPEEPAVVGIKGLPGTPGIGAGHVATFYQEHDTPDRSRLRDLVGDEDAYRYLEIVARARPARGIAGESQPGVRRPHSLR